VKTNYKNYFDSEVVVCLQLILYIMSLRFKKKTEFFGRHLHLELCHLAREMNFIFAVQMIFTMACCLSYLTTLFYYLYWMLIQKHREKMYSIYDWFSIICWVFVLLMRIYIINYFCENVIQKVK